MPIGHMLAEGIMQTVNYDNDVDNDAESALNFFDSTYVFVPFALATGRAREVWV